MEQTKVRELQDVVIRFSGDSGDGMQLTGTLFSDTSALMAARLSGHCQRAIMRTGRRERVYLAPRPALWAARRFWGLTVEPLYSVPSAQRRM